MQGRSYKVRSSPASYKVCAVRNGNRRLFWGASREDISCGQNPKTCRLSRGTTMRYCQGAVKVLWCQGDVVSFLSAPHIGGGCGDLPKHFSENFNESAICQWKHQRDIPNCRFGTAAKGGFELCHECNAFGIYRSEQEYTFSESFGLLHYDLRKILLGQPP